MIKIKEAIFFEECEQCNGRENINIIFNKNAAMVLCDKCLQELNHKIVEYLTEKNL